VNEANQVRLKLAEDNVAVYAANPKVKAVLITGSVARGYADDNSDIDTLILYETLPSQEEFDQVCADAKASGGGFLGGTSAEGFAVYAYAQGIKCDFAHGPVELEERRIATMLDKPDLDPINHIILSGLLDAIPLHGRAWFEPWRAKLKNEYPPALAEMMVQKHLSFQPRWVLDKMGVDRSERLFLYESYLAAVENILGVLYGLNRRYHPGKLKGVAWMIEQ
jgi:nucleotidyltransferase-like protein